MVVQTQAINTPVRKSSVARGNEFMCSWRHDQRSGGLSTSNYINVLFFACSPSFSICAPPCIATQEGGLLQSRNRLLGKRRDVAPICSSAAATHRATYSLHLCGPRLQGTSDFVFCGIVDKWVWEFNRASDEPKKRVHSYLGVSLWIHGGGGV